MYESFYGLKERPFNLTPDPKYLYLSDKHKEAFAHLLYGIRNRSGFVMVTGEIGTGKTTICRNLLNQLDTETELAFIFNPALDPVALLKKICVEFGMETAAESILELTEELNQHLLKAAQAGRSCVLVIDEAQNLSPQVLEQIRLLSNLETETEKLLQIILIGQPELAEKLALNELRQLNQRITARYHLKALNRAETLQYVAYRLHVAGGRKKVHFAKAAIRALYKYTGGTPRLINAICDRALLIGYTRESHVISKAIVSRAAKEIRGEKIGRRSTFFQRVRAWMPSPALMAVGILLVVAVRFLALPIDHFTRELRVFNAFLTSDVPQPIPPAETPPAASPASAPDKTQLAQDVANVLVQSDTARKVLQRLVNPENASAKADTSGLAALLAPLDPEVARNAAATALLRAWDLALLGAPPANDEPETLAAFAQQNGLASEQLGPALEQLITVDLPAFVRVKAGEKTLWIALTGASGNRCTVSTEVGKSIEVSREALREVYLGEVLVLWRDPAPTTPVLFPGAEGKAVGLMKEQLRKLHRLPEDNTGETYDKKSAAAISRLQAETGLMVDGIAGKQVRMVLASWAHEGDMPSLQGRKAAAPAPAPAPAAEAKARHKEAPAEPKKEAKAAEPERPAVHAKEEKPPKPVETPPAPATPVEAPKPVESAPAVPAATVAPAAAEAPAVTPAPAPAPSVQIQALPQPAADNSLPPANTDSLKESTAPAPGSPPLLPHPAP